MMEIKKKKRGESHLRFIFQQIHKVAVMDRVAITAPPATTAMSQIGRPLWPPSWNSLSPLVKTDCSVVGEGVPFFGVETGSVMPPCFFVVFPVRLVLEGVVCIIT